MAIRVHQTEVNMSMSDGEVITPMQMSRIVAAVIAQLRRQEQDEHSRSQDTKVVGSSCSSCQHPGGHGG